ncbi:MAG TPA: class I SAM-dependent methyltransferase [Gemmatimonadaceae bacterium]|nr:class I SAM-dependent methyltransferase [Gemmatimonadaceae bacterium]
MFGRMTSAAPEIRFGFGQNWQRFVNEGVGEEQIASAVTSMRDLLKLDSLQGKSFLDIGCGSGLHSLAAVRLGAARVMSFDYDINSVRATEQLRAAASPGGESWRVEQGSVLDPEYLQKLGTFDVVYSWGVLHHTGRMWDAIRNAAERTAPGGLFCIAIYNTSKPRTVRAWSRAKRFYCKSPGFVQAAMVGAYGTFGILVQLAHRRNPFRTGERGMRFWRDIADWLGGYPYETATAGELFEFVAPMGFQLVTLHSVSNGGNHQLTFRRSGPEPQQAG